MTLIKIFKFNFENNKKIKLKNEINKFKYPIILKNYSNNIYAYPHIFVRPYTSFYNLTTFHISHPYFHKESIKKPSFPYFLPHYYFLKSIIDKNNEEIYFKEECEIIKKTNIICGNIFITKNYLYFISDNNIKSKYGKNIKYLFCSMIDDIKLKDKIILIKNKDIQEIINRRYIYDYRAFEIFLKNGKSYYFNLYSKESLNNFFEEIDKIKNKENDFNIIKEPVKYFKNKKYSQDWQDNIIDTYQYLLYINKFASRSYNDINQYPIFPWIFLESKRGSHKNKGTIPIFRNLAYPISVKNEEDIKDALLFFEANLDENPKFPFHYRLHYSTSGYLLSYLVRLSPFTEEQIRFQNNQFDSPSRQINSIDEILSILSTSHDNRELVPEYFSSIEFCLNTNYADFGFRLSDKVMINDVQYPEKYFNSICQYIYYSRLMLNYKPKMQKINEEDFIDELKIDEWINLIFGIKQWDEKPKKNKLNLFGKYSYRQNINFDKILDKYKSKGFDDKKIISKIESKKARIINFGQCPEVLFKSKHKESFLLNISEEEKTTDEIELKITNTIDINEFEKKLKKEFIIASFWLSESNSNEFIYFLVFEKNDNFNDSNSLNKQYILVYKNDAQEKINPDYIINIEEINLFNLTAKKIIYNNKINNIRESNTFNLKNDNNNIHNERFFSGQLNEDSKNGNLGMNQKKLSNKDLAKSMNYNEINNKEENYVNFIHYKLSPKNCLFDICLEKKIYFFVGRNLDNSIKIYEIELNKGNKGNKGKVKYKIPTDNFVSCLHKKNKYLFFSGHKNGKLYEWRISYSLDKNKKDSLINRIELVRDLIAHKESMIICIKYIIKHNIILTSSNDGKLFIRKNCDFELLSVIEPHLKNCIIYQIIYSNYDLLYLSIHYKDKKFNYRSCINVFTLNGLFIESSPNEHLIDIEPLKNGKIICNTLYSNYMNIFGLNNKLGQFNKYDIFREILVEKSKINNFIFQHKNNCFYILLENKKLIKQQISDFDYLIKEVDKLSVLYKDKKNNNESRKSSISFSKDEKKRQGSF